MTAKFAALPFSSSVRIVLREVDVDGLFLARLRAEQLFLEAGDELARAQPQDEPLGGAALEGLAVDAADEVDRDLVAVFRLGPLLRGAEMPVLLAEAPDRFVDFLVLRPDDHALELQRGEVDRLDLRHQLEIERGIRGPAPSSNLRSPISGCIAGADPLVLDRAGSGVLDRRLQDLAP